MKRTRNQKGFTIMELMIVIIIIGILIAIAVPAYTNFRTRAQKAACNANVRAVQTAVGIYIADTGSNPATLGALTAAAPPYIDAIPACTVTGAGAGVISITGSVVSCSVHGN